MPHLLIVTVGSDSFRYLFALYNFLTVSYFVAKYDLQQSHFSYDKVSARSLYVTSSVSPF